MKEDIMRMLSGFLALVLLLGTVPVVWAQADPAKEVADIRAKQGAAGAKGEVDGVMAPMADNVVFTAARPGFRIEGKEAVRAFLTNLFQNYPTRQELARQVTYRVYQEGQRRRGQQLCRPGIYRQERTDEHVDAAEQPDVGEDRRSPAARRCAQLGYAGRPVHSVAQNSAL